MRKKLVIKKKQVTIKWSIFIRNNRINTIHNLK